ncbi:pyridoxal-phosphate dependent enzyme domain-containing protein [Phthorimaea operculella]|nr:pyridoxal-phosphate dependent enzyme domain-containing protein [Phthorimaea operculella]
MDDDFDPMCDPNKPRQVTFNDISAAAFLIQNGIMKTPCVPSHISEKVELELYLKCEFLQYTGSFKERGVRNAILRLTPEQKKNGVIAASLGNHSQGMSYHGVKLGVPTTVVMPTVAPIMKIQKCRLFGAEVIIHGLNMTDAKRHALQLSKERNATYINGYDHPDVLAGQGTIGLEILEQVPDVEAILVPVGGGGLLAGIIIAVKHLKPDVLVYGVETDKCASMTGSIKAGKIVPITITRTLADGLAVGSVGVNSFYNIQPLVDRMVVVTEDNAALAILNILEQEKYVVEGGGAVTTAAILAGLVPELRGKKVVCVLSGGNIDTSILSVCLERGLVAEQRLVKFKVNISCSPGSLAKLCGLISSIDVPIKDIVQEHTWLKGNIFSIRVKIVCETTGPDHVRELQDLISKNYKECFFMREFVRKDQQKDQRQLSLTDSLIQVASQK